MPRYKADIAGGALKVYKSRLVADLLGLPVISAPEVTLRKCRFFTGSAASMRPSDNILINMNIQISRGGSVGIAYAATSRQHLELRPIAKGLRRAAYVRHWELLTVWKLGRLGRSLRP